MTDDIKINEWQESHCVVNGKVYYKDTRVHSLAKSILVLISEVREEIK